MRRRNRTRISDEQYKEMQQELKTRRKQQNIEPPSIELREMGLKARLEVPEEERTPIFLDDMQHLLLTLLLHSKSPCMPSRWVRIDNWNQVPNCTVLVVNGIGLYEYYAYGRQFFYGHRIFEHTLEMVVPVTKKHLIIKHLAQAPLVMANSKQLLQKHGTLEAALDMQNDPTVLLDSIYNIKDPANVTLNYGDALPPQDAFPRTKLLLNPLQMVDEGYPMPLHGYFGSQTSHYKYTKDVYERVHNFSPMFGIDCEMCMTAQAHELTRISVVNEQLDTLYETLVRPSNKIVDYLTRFSGITEQIMIGATKTLKDVQRDIVKLLPSDAILVGQSLNSDLNAMQMLHPYVIDTSVCFNLSGSRRHKSRLKTLSKEFLDEQIQANVEGHDSVEDSLASLKLVKFKLRKSLEFGDVFLSRRRLYYESLLQENVCPIRTKPVSVITVGNCFDQELKTLIEEARGVIYQKCATNKQVFKSARNDIYRNAMTLANIDIDLEGMDEKRRITEMEFLDNNIETLYKTLPKNGIFIVILGGNMACPSGMACLALR